MSNSIPGDRPTCAVIPYLTESNLPRSETNNAEGTDVRRPSKGKGGKRTRGFKGGEVLKSNPRVLDGERVVMVSIKGSEGRSLFPSKCPERPIALRSLLRATGVSSEVYSAFALVVPSPFEVSSPLHLQSPHIPQRTLIETSTRLYRTRFYEICGTGKGSAVVDEPLRSKRTCSRGQMFEKRLICFLG